MRHSEAYIVGRAQGTELAVRWLGSDEALRPGEDSACTAQQHSQKTAVDLELCNVVDHKLALMT